jgi:DNA polymerase
VPARRASRPPAEPRSAKPTSLRLLKAEAAECRACDLWKRGTQTVFGAGPRRATLMLVGEQPGNDEDLAGLPFVGPAGKLLDRALEAAGIERGRVYLTNVVKHFKWKPRGKRRLHEKPRDDEVEACLPWLEAEIAAVRPALVVCLGATAARALLGKQFRVTRQRGEVFARPGRPPTAATIHPSAVLRAPDAESRHREMAALVADLKKLAGHIGR